MKFKKDLKKDNLYKLKIMSVTDFPNISLVTILHENK